MPFAAKTNEVTPIIDYVPSDSETTESESEKKNEDEISENADEENSDDENAEDSENSDDEDRRVKKILPRQNPHPNQPEPKRFSLLQSRPRRPSTVSGSIKTYI